MKIAFYTHTKKGWQGVTERLIRWWTRGNYSHCELVLSESNGISECGSSSGIDGGVRIKHMALDPSHWDVVEIGLGDPSRAKAWFLAHDGDKYDFFGLLGFVIRRGDLDEKNKWWCSEAVAAALGLPEPWRYDPNTLAAVSRIDFKLKGKNDHSTTR